MWVDIWNPWHGCTKYSEGCVNCYVYRRDSSIGKDASVLTKTGDYTLPIRKNRQGEYKLAPGRSIFTCMTSDFFLDRADELRSGAWDMIRERSDVDFVVITKRILRVRQCLPDDWGAGWDNFTLYATMENQRCADERMDEFLSLPVKKRSIVCEPMVSGIDFRGKLDPDIIDSVSVGGESGPGARALDYDWVLDVRRQCLESGVSFVFRQTGARLIKDGKLYRIERMLQQAQAKRANIDVDYGRR